MPVCFEISLQHINHESLWSFFVLTLHTALVLIWGNAWKSQAVFKNVHDWISLVDPHNQTNPFMSAYQPLWYTLPHEIFLQFLPFEWSEVILYNISAGEIVFITTVSRSKAFRLRVPKIYGSMYDHQLVITAYLWLALLWAPHLRNGSLDNPAPYLYNGHICSRSLTL